MKYPESFIRRVKAAYPTFTALHEALDRGDEMAGRYLNDSAPHGPDPTTIVMLFCAHKPRVVLKLAKEALAKKKLYEDWHKLYEQQKERQTA